MAPELACILGALTLAHINGICVALACTHGRQSSARPVLHQSLNYARCCRVPQLHQVQSWPLQVMDFFGVALPFAGIMVATEGKIGFAWGAALLVVGSPVACGYIAWKLTRGSIALSGDASDYSYYPT